MVGIRSAPNLRALNALHDHRTILALGRFIVEKPVILDFRAVVSAREVATDRFCVGTEAVRRDLHLRRIDARSEVANEGVRIFFEALAEVPGRD